MFDSSILFRASYKSNEKIDFLNEKLPDKCLLGICTNFFSNETPRILEKATIGSPGTSQKYDVLFWPTSPSCPYPCQLFQLQMHEINHCNKRLKQE